MSLTVVARRQPLMCWGQLPLACVDLTSVAEQIKAGNLVPIGVTAAKRFSIAPEIPTIAEQGLKGFDVPAWLGMFGPSALPAEVIDQFSGALSKAMSDTDVSARVERLACQSAFLGAKEFALFIREQSDKMKPLVKLVEKT